MGEEVSARTCIGCGAQRPKKELIRLSRDDGRIVIETTGEQLGRGAYLCPSKSCFQGAVKRKTFQKALSITLDEAGVEALAKEFQAKIRIVGSESNAQN